MLAQRQRCTVFRSMLSCLLYLSGDPIYSQLVRPIDSAPLSTGLALTIIKGLFWGLRQLPGCLQGFGHGTLSIECTRLTVSLDHYHTSSPLMSLHSPGSQYPYPLVTLAFGSISLQTQPLIPLLQKFPFMKPGDIFRAISLFRFD